MSNLFIKSALSQFNPYSEEVQTIRTTSTDGEDNYRFISIEEVLSMALNCIKRQEKEIEELSYIKRIIEKARED